MTIEEFGILAKAMKAMYSDPKFIADSDAFNVWYELIKDIPYEIGHVAIQKYMSTNRFAPTVADIRQIALEVSSPRQLDEGEAWALTYKAICNSAYNSKEEFEKLPKACQRAVGNPAILREWAGLNIDEVNTVIHSNFLRSYKVACAREKEYAQLPGGTRAMIDKLAESFSMKRIEG